MTRYYICTHVVCIRYDENGNAIGTPEITPPTPIRLNWEIKHECQGAIDKSMKVVASLIQDIDLRIYVHNNYGKGFIKRCRLSPDAYLQMALQLAYYRDAGKFDLTYEASMTRLYREGRTETVRPCTVQSSKWVKSMEDPNCSTEQRVQLLIEACEKHQVRRFKHEQNSKCVSWITVTGSMPLNKAIELFKTLSIRFFSRLPTKTPCAAKASTDTCSVSM